MTMSYNSVISNVEELGSSFSVRRKRHHKRSSQNIKNFKNTTIEKLKLENILMVYFYF